MLKVFGALARLYNLAYALVFVGGCGYFGVDGVKDRVTWEPPQTVACDARTFEGKRWVRVEGCQRDPRRDYVSYDRRTFEIIEGWMPLRPANGDALPPIAVHTRHKERFEAANAAVVTMAPFVIKRLDSAPADVTTQFPAGTVFFEEHDGEKPPLVWPVICTLAAGFWLLVAVGNLLPRKNKGEPASSSPPVSAS